MAEKTWLTYREAAKRVSSSERTVRNWASWGMQMSWAEREGQRVRVVEVEVLLAFWRQKMQENPVHFLRMRKRMAEEGITVETPEHVKAMRIKASETLRGIRVPEPAESVSFGRTEPENATPEPKVDPLADMKPLKGGAEYWELTDRLRVTTPRCAGMSEFTADRVSPEDAERMAGICAECPLLEQCRAFALASKPVAGFWPVATSPALARH